MKSIFIADKTRPEVAIPIARKLGMGIELQAFYKPSMFDEEGIVERHRKLLSGFTGERAMHGPFIDFSYVSVDRNVREYARMRMQKAWDMAFELGVTHMVYHYGYIPRTYPKDEYLQRSIRFWRDFLSDKPAGISVHLENTLELTPDIIIEFIDTVALPNVTVNLDLGHTNCNSTIPTVDWIRRLGRRIAYVHMHDNDGSEDQHAGIGQGTIPFDEVCAALEEHSPQAIWSLETDGPGLEVTLTWLRVRGYL